MNKGNYLIQKITLVLLPILMVGQSINNFDVEPDPGTGVLKTQIMLIQLSVTRLYLRFQMQ